MQVQSWCLSVAPSLLCPHPNPEPQAPGLPRPSVTHICNTGTTSHHYGNLSVLPPQALPLMGTGFPFSLSSPFPSGYRRTGEKWMKGKRQPGKERQDVGKLQGLSKDRQNLRDWQSATANGQGRYGPWHSRGGNRGKTDSPHLAELFSPIHFFARMSLPKLGPYHLMLGSLTTAPNPPLHLISPLTQHKASPQVQLNNQALLRDLKQQLPCSLH